MIKTISPFIPSGTINPPSSKSYCHRYLIMAFIRDEEITIDNFNFCDDTIVTINALKKLGAIIETTATSVRYLGRDKPQRNPIIYVGSSGSTLRMLLPLACYLCNQVTFTGNDDLFKRPMDIYEELLTTLGIPYSLNEASITIKKKLDITNFEIKGNLSSQFISGLLFLLAEAKSKNTLKITTEIVSRPYVDLTLEVIDKLGVMISENDNTFRFEKDIYRNVSRIYVEADYSAASNYIALGCLCGDLSISNMSEASSQADSKIISLLRSCGAEIKFDENVLNVYKSTLRPFELDLSNCIDLGPIIFVIASLIGGTSKITGFENLKYKESNRLNAMTTELRKVGVDIEQTNNAILITGRTSYSGKYTFETYNDHRIAMALTIFSVASLIECTLMDAECVSKSYGAFYDDIEKLNHEAN